MQDDWSSERPDLDSSNMGVVLRIQYMARVLNDQASEALSDMGLEWWEYDVLSTLRRQGEPFEMTASELAAASLLTSGAMTTRVDRLVDRGLVSRCHDDRDRRRVLVRLTATGQDLVDHATVARFESADETLALLPLQDREQLSSLLRGLVLASESQPDSPGRSA